MVTGFFDKNFIPQAVSETSDSDKIINQIENVKNQIKMVEELFDLCEDEALIETCCYQLKAFSCYYNYLLEQARRSNCKYIPERNDIGIISTGMRAAGLL